MTWLDVAQYALLLAIGLILVSMIGSDDNGRFR